VSNVILELHREIARVRILLPKFDPAVRQLAAGTIRYAEASLAQNQYEAIREAIEDLQEFRLPPVIVEGESQ